MSEAVQRYAKVPADMSRDGWARHADHVATTGGVNGRGTSQAAALEGLAANLAGMAAHVHDAPVFGWDDANSTLWVAVPSPFGGSTHYIVPFDAAGKPSVSGSVTSASAPARDAWKCAEGIEQLRSPFYRD
jgi:hypothetical protein